MVEYVKACISKELVAFCLAFVALNLLLCTSCLAASALYTSCSCKNTFYSNSLQSCRWCLVHWQAGLVLACCAMLHVHYARSSQRVVEFELCMHTLTVKLCICTGMCISCFKQRSNQRDLKNLCTSDLRLTSDCFLTQWQLGSQSAKHACCQQFPVLKSSEKLQSRLLLASNVSLAACNAGTGRVNTSWAG